MIKRIVLISLNLVIMIGFSIVLSGCTEQQSVTPNDLEIVSKTNQTELTDQEKCENSGGKWKKLCPDCQGCPCSYYCGCIIKRESQKNQTLVETKIEKNNECFSCQTDFDCRLTECIMIKDSDCMPQHCGMDRNACLGITQECINGSCVATNKTYGSYNNRTHDCINGECVPCGDTCVTK